MIKKEKHFQDQCIVYLKRRGIYYLNLYGDGFSGKGKPDIIACIDGKLAAFELKVGANGMTDAQRIHKERIEHSGGLHFTPRTYAEFTAIVEGLLNEGENAHMLDKGEST